MSLQQRIEMEESTHEEGSHDTEEEARQDIINNRQTSPLKLAFITATELPKFKDNRTSCDDIFTKGPEIGEFCDNFRAYLVGHNITNSQDKITALKMNILASQGDVKYTLSSILDDNKNSGMITFEQVETLLK